MFITFEGIDYSGKSTQVKLLSDRLAHEGRSVVVLREPGGTAVSEAVRTILLDRQHLAMEQWTELFLFSAARAQLVREVIRPALTASTIVICDRFADSTTAYQGYGRGLALEHVRLVNSIATDGLTPDVTFIVEIPVAESIRRRTHNQTDADRMESAGQEFYDRVFEGYRRIAAGDPGRCIILDGTQPVQDIHEKLWATICQRLR